MPASSAPESAAGSQIKTGLAGRSILSSRSPWMHECEAAAQGIALSYTLFDFNDRGWEDSRLDTLLHQCEADGFAGINITFPFKQAVVPLLHDLSDAARRIGAVNTVKFQNGQRIGHNTDVSGFAHSIRNGLPDAALGGVVLIGCGGAGSATAHALLECGVERLYLFDHDAQKRSDLAENLRQSFGADRIDSNMELAQSVPLADGIVNATPVGMASYPGLPLHAELITPRHWVADIVYFPLDTALLIEAKAKGCQTLNGSGMAVGQAAEAFEIFTGLAVNRPRMVQSFLEFVSSPANHAA